MDFKFHPDFTAWIDREAARLPTLVEDLTSLAKSTRPASRDDDEHEGIYIPEEDIIGEITESHSDLYGRLRTRFFREEGRVLGLTGANLVEVLKFAERISSRKELQNIISAETVREIVLRWIGAAVRNWPTAPLATEIAQTIRDNVKPLNIWIPIEETQVAGELVFADATLKMASLRELDSLMEPRLGSAPPEQARLRKDQLHRVWRGKAIMCFSFDAEPKRAEELAFEKAEAYMALLQFYGVAPHLFRLTSYAAPSGARPRQPHRSIAFSQGAFAHSFSGFLGPQCWWLQLSAQQAEDVSFRILSSLGSGPACDYEEAVLKSLLVYGRACYQVDPGDKLLQTITAVEMLTLRDNNEPLMNAVGDRMAFVIAEGADKRQSVVTNFRRVYRFRSRKTHHGHDIEETKEIEIFLENVWKFFQQVIFWVGRHKTRDDFLKDLDRLKYC